MHIVLSRQSIAGFFTTLASGLGFLSKREDRLIASAKLGDRESFESLQLMYSALLKKFVARRVSEADRDDLLQETWLAAWESLHLFDDRGKFRGWLLTIAFRRIQDFRRREHVRPKLSLFDQGDGPTYIQSEFSAIEVSSVLSSFWNSCSDDQRELLTMYYSEGLTLQEIGKIKSRNLNTVKYQFYKLHNEALKTLPAGSEAISSQEVPA